MYNYMHIYIYIYLCVVETMKIYEHMGIVYDSSLL